MKNTKHKDKKLSWEKPSMDVLKVSDTNQTSPFGGKKSVNGDETQSSTYIDSQS